MSKNPDDEKLLDHEYDGIQELDNNLPLWWLWTFFGAIIFSFIYWLHYSFTGDGPSLDETLKAQMAQIEQNRQKAAQKSESGEGPSEEEMLAMGQQTYRNYCASCHMENGGGSVGPNLTDDYWIHGAETASIKKVIVEGVLNKGMPAWSDVLKPQEIKAVVMYVENFKGTNVAGGKEPQGEKITE